MTTLEHNRMRALVVDDTALYRKILSDALHAIPGVEVVGTAHNGREALEMMTSLKPDIATLDIEMPEMTGIEVLEALRGKRSETVIIVVSALTRQGGALTLRALELGAFDFIAKPQTGTLAENREAIGIALAPLVQTLARRKGIKDILTTCAAPDRPNMHATTSAVLGNDRFLPIHAIHQKGNSEIVAIALSTGGPNALAQLLPAFPADFAVPILIIQHMPPVFTASLAQILDEKCALHVKEAADGDSLLPGWALIAPGGRQMKVEKKSDGITKMIRITDDPPENNCRPAADYLFRSIARHYPGRATGVIMTGMGMDGFEGLQLMRAGGSFVIAQDENSCVVYGMPKAPTEKGIANIVSPLANLAEQIIQTVK
jgi:two-component system chemotaxis response regulator CheB